MNTSRPQEASARTSVSWSAYVAADYTFTDFPAGARVLDIGFGRGEQMRGIAKNGATAFGIEYDETLARRGRASGLAVCRASAEQLPVQTGTLDGVICKVVVLLTDEAKSVSEIGRVLRPGGIGHIVSHGIGYSLRYLVAGDHWKTRLYALRTIVNTWVYGVTGRRLPGFWGDTLYQGTPTLRRYYERAGLELIREHPSPRFAGAPVFIYHTVRRVASDARARSAGSAALETRQGPDVRVGPGDVRAARGMVESSAGPTTLTGAAMTPQDARTVADFLLGNLEMEVPITLGVFGAVPDGRLDYQPDPKSKTALALVRHIALEDEWFLDAVAEGRFGPPPDESDASGILRPADASARYGERIPALIARLRSLPPDALVREIDLFGMIQMPAIQFLSLVLRHSAHHRGQLSAYLRAMGGKVPAIYGPSADTATASA